MPEPFPVRAVVKGCSDAHTQDGLAQLYLSHGQWFGIMPLDVSTSPRESPKGVEARP